MNIVILIMLLENKFGHLRPKTLNLNLISNFLSNKETLIFIIFDFIPFKTFKIVHLKKI